MLGELLPVSVAFKTIQTALEADSPGNSGTKQQVPFTKPKLESHSLLMSHLLPSDGWQSLWKGAGGGDAILVGAEHRLKEEERDGEEASQLLAASTASVIKNHLLSPIGKAALNRIN